MNYLIIVLIKMRLLIFLAFSQHGSAYKYEHEMISKFQYIIGCKTSFSNTWCNNCQSGKATTET